MKHSKMNEKSVRSEIYETGNPRIKSGRIVIDAPAHEIFILLANPRRHKDFDGTKTIQENRRIVWRHFGRWRWI
jgi:hypothetical protein